MNPDIKYAIRIDFRRMFKDPKIIKNVIDYSIAEEKDCYIVTYTKNAYKRNLWDEKTVAHFTVRFMKDAIISIWIAENLSYEQSTNKEIARYAR